MSAVTIHTELKNLSQEDTFLDSVPLNKFYNLLNDKSKEPPESNFCKNVAKNEIKNGTHSYNLCNILINILKKRDEILKNFEGSNNIKFCNYLHYWIYDQIKDDNVRTQTTKIIYSIFDWIPQSISDKKCFRNNYFIDESKFKKKKKLFEFLEYYESLNVKIDDKKTIESEKYCSYIKDMHDLYYNMLSEDMVKNSKVYSEELLAFERIFNKKELCNLKNKCPDICPLLPHIKSLKLECLTEKQSHSYSDQGEERSLAITDKDIVEEDQSKLEDIITNLPSNEMYKELNEDFTVYYYDDYCSKIIPLNGKYCGIYSICAKIAKNLKKIILMKNKEERNDRCFYFNHWIYDIIKKTYNFDSEYVGNMHPTNELIKVVYDINNTFDKKISTNRCYANYKHDDTFKKLKEKKDLHDYFKNYKKIEEKIPSDKNNNTRYSAYVEYIDSLYNNHKNECCSDFLFWNEEDCPEYFRCSENFNPQNLLSILKGEVKGVNHLTELPQSITNQSHNDPWTSTLKDDPTNVRFKCYKKGSLIDGISHALVCEDQNTVQIENTVSEQASSKGGSLTVNDITPNSNSQNTHNIVTSDFFRNNLLGAFAVIGISTMFFLYYKFTPFGSILNKGIQSKKESTNYLHEEDIQESSLHSTEIIKGNTKNKRLHLVYHSV
ncbi:PIR Superfamily Protein [Plasmodium ovale wallikeri]|uniref:PIR Superfamily Protein n=1 Tax=Plasmodium ovale wallikeri TaxID=864142 RepID=A0A1A9ANR2_PLAOA|nr:PIR Superfamily Protein [Plasmodium ovale wallikeri]SBT57733.1 PIR Superfamily Protein [Plasmodium ovale wallikeri]